MEDCLTWQLEGGQVNMLFSYTNGKYKQETDEVNGYLVRRIRDQNRGITKDDSISQAGKAHRHISGRALQLQFGGRRAAVLFWRSPFGRSSERCRPSPEDKIPYEWLPGLRSASGVYLCTYIACPERLLSGLSYLLPMSMAS
eukprot:678442-Amphidinium_carterae.3